MYNKSSVRSQIDRSKADISLSRTANTPNCTIRFALGRLEFQKTILNRLSCLISLPGSRRQMLFDTSAKWTAVKIVNAVVKARDNRMINYHLSLAVIMPADAVSRFSIVDRRLPAKCKRMSNRISICQLSVGDCDKSIKIRINNCSISIFGHPHPPAWPVQRARFIH